MRIRRKTRLWLFMYWVIGPLLTLALIIWLGCMVSQIVAS
jgi:hypothetical protein